MRLKPVAVASLLLAFGVASAAAQNRDPQTIIRNLDRDGDQRLSRAEFKGTTEQFGNLDKDADGFVTLSEFQARGQRSGGGKQSANNSPNSSGGPRGDPAALLKAQDLNGDGRVSLREWMHFYEARFLRSDRDGDGHLTEAEMIPPDR